MLSSAFAGSIGTALAASAFAPVSALHLVAGLSGAFGALLGLTLGAAQLGLSRHQPITAGAVWIALGATLGVSTALELGAWEKLKGPHAPLALATLIAGVLLGMAWGALMALGQPAGAEHARVATRSQAWRIGSIGALLAASFLAGACDAAVDWLAVYPAAQRALIGACWTLMTALVLTVIDGWSCRVALIAGSIWVVVVATGLWRLARAADGEGGGVSSSNQSRRLLQLSWRLTDWDGDGASSWFAGGDCAPTNAAIHPGAREIPGNGLDDNCSFGDARPRLIASMLAPPAARPNDLDIVLITVDALRADHTVPYGYHRQTTPHLATFARRAIRYDNAYTAGSWTWLALPAMLSSRYPRRLRWKPMVATVNNAILPVPYEPHLASGDAFQMMLMLPREERRWTMQAALRRRGLRTIVVANPSGPIRAFIPRFGDGWDVIAFGDGAEDRNTTDQALAQLATLGDTHFFLWVHYFDPHEPQTVHEGAPFFGEGLEDRYDHEVASADRQIGRLIEALEARPGRIVIVIAADHGEAFDGGLQFHGTDLNGDLLRIPLLLRAPGVEPGVVSVPASLVDIAPTLLALSGAEMPANLDGENLLKLNAGRVVIADLFRIDRDRRVTLDAIAVSSATHRLTYDRSHQHRALVAAKDVNRQPTELELEQTPESISQALGSYLESIAGGPMD